MDTAAGGVVYAKLEPDGFVSASGVRAHLTASGVRAHLTASGVRAHLTASGVRLRTWRASGASPFARP
jgi:hypothetical protein